MGKGAVDESLPNYGGVYAGDGSNAGVREIVESSDLVLSIGAIKSDFVRSLELRVHTRAHRTCRIRPASVTRLRR